MAKTRFAKRTVFIQFGCDGDWVKGFVKRICFDAGSECLEVIWENGNREFVFVSSIFRIVEENPRPARVVDFEKRRKKRLKLVKT